ncbi:SBBP repeat-containing protein [Marinicella sp. X102]|nr:SBBP repeat-containing protein [Marinicella marina]
MKTLLLTLILMVTSSAWSAWPTGGGGTSDETVVDTVTASNGDTYVIGQFQGSAVFDGIELNSSGLNDIYVLKLNQGGTVEWAIRAGGSSDDIPQGITVDEAGNAYIVGSHFGVSRFGQAELTASASVKNGFLAKINAGGGWVWAKKMGSIGFESEVVDVKTNEGQAGVIPPEEGAVFVTGYFRQNANIDGNITLSSGLGVNSSELYLAKFEHDGDFQWAEYRNDPRAEFPTNLDISDDGVLIVTGKSTGIVDIYAENFNSMPGNNIFQAGWGSNWNPTTCPFPGISGWQGQPHYGNRAHNKPGNPTNDLYLGGTPQVNGSTNFLQNLLVYSPSYNTVGIGSYTVSFDVIEGGGGFSEPPDPGENLYVYLAPANAGTSASTSGYYYLGEFAGGGTRTNARFSYNIPANVFPNGARLVFRKNVSTGSCYDAWHVDNITVQGTGSAENFVFDVTNTGSSSPSLNSEVSFNSNIQVNDMVYDDENNRVIISGTNVTDGTSYCGQNVPAGSVLSSFNTDLSCDWVRYPTHNTVFDQNNNSRASTSSGQGLTVDNDGFIYQTGFFQGSITQPNIQNQCAAGAALFDETIESDNEFDDVFMMSFNPDGVACWLTGGNFYDDTDGYPAIMGDIETERGISITTDGIGSLFVAGEMQSSILFGQDNRFDGNGGTDIFITNWGLDGRPFQVESWPVGVALVAPPSALLDNVTLIPEFFRNGEPVAALQDKLFYWQGPIGQEGTPDYRLAQLIPLQPFNEIEVHWRTSSDLTNPNRVITSGVANWPSEPCENLTRTEECYQLHAAGAPVEIEPASGEYIFFELAFGSGDAIVNNKVFNNNLSGFSSMVYLNGPAPDPTTYPVEIEVVRTVPFSSLTDFKDNVDWEIGKKVTNDIHNEIGRTGYVLNELAYYDGTGISAAYNRSARTGQIIPVNRIVSSRPQDVGRELSVAWYKNNSRGVYWPDSAVRYNPQWPFDPDKIIIASQLGGEVLGQDPLDPLTYPSQQIYIQSDPNLPGFNPNDEHAIFAPSNTGTGYEAVFALRSDFGSELQGDASASSDPYVLVKYYDEAVLEWKMRVYEVLATGAGYNSFQFTGLAATTVSPPYPVRLLPSCIESRAVGQAQGEQPPPPFFQDYKAQIWAKSAGSGELLYHYPLQPGFFYDLDNNDVQDDINADGEPDLDTTCVPWLARLSEEKGGTANPTDPIKIRYDITWPSDVPQLVIGETLLTPKRGLPDIINQAAVQVVYDDLYDSLPEPLPTDTLAQMIDPLSPRFVVLDEVPEEIATELQTTGLDLILGSADGTIKLPAAIKKRMSYDSLNSKLILQGLFDETGAGEPLLVPNVLSKTDRVALKKLDGGNGTEESSFTGDCQVAGCSWDEAVEALFRLSRNPNGIERICTNSIIGENNVRQCLASNPVTADDVLIGYQDTNNDYVLEPFVAVGAQAALTAGSAQGSGFMTIAFNNDPSLTPLPVSLNIIRVDCLISPPPPEVAVINKPYQGQLQVIAPENIFDEQIVLRHSGDFGGNPDALEFEWFFQPDSDGTPPEILPVPESGQLNGWIKYPVSEPLGANEITIAGANIQTLSDNWYIARYRGLPSCNNGSEWSLWAGQPGATPLNERAQLAEGWVKRVLKRLNPFEARVQNFAQAGTNNYASMLIQLGERYEGDIAMNNDPDNLNSIGLIEAYTTVMRRALSLSVNSTPPVNYEPANNAILLVASRLVDFYTLLGNEAYADAQDPMIGISTEDGVVSLAPTIFNFQNQLDSLLSEELVLLRGRDDSQGPVAANPVYNRLFWNFTTGDGEVAYALSYNISDQNSSGVIDEFDARIQFPQGHGDAWGHYLTATDIYYELLKNPFYSWNPRAEAITIAGAPIQVDFLDERQFAETAAAKARVGAEVVDLTYRSAYVEDPAGQYQGYVDSDAERAWGVSGWGHRAGMAAYFDWVTVNSIIPSEDPDPDKVGIQRIERSNIFELDEIAAQYLSIQAQIDESDRGLNPLGLASGVVPFDIDPSLLNAGINSRSHFEQVYERAEQALDNVISVWDFANQINNLMRQNQDSVDDLTDNAIFEENDFNNQLIEIFGMPYDDDIGPGGTYPAGYDGPDLYHYMYIDSPALAGTAFDFSCTEGTPGNCTGYDPSTNSVGVIREFTGSYAPIAGGLGFYGFGPNELSGEAAAAYCGDTPLAQGCALGTITTDSLDVTYQTIESADLGFAFAKPDNWTGSRRAVGRLQEVQNEMVQARIALRQAMIDYDILRQDVNDAIQGLRATFNVLADNLSITNDANDTILAIEASVFAINTAAAIAHRTAEGLDTTFETTGDCIPGNFVAGLAAGGDLFSTIRCGTGALGDVTAFAVDSVGDGLEVAANGVELSINHVATAAERDIQINDSDLELYNVSGEIDVLLRQEPALRAEIYARAETARQLIGKYNTTLNEGLQVGEKLTAFRRSGAAAIQEYRYEDMAFRIFRNDALQKYRAAFDQAARYVYMAAAAYDYETNLLGSDSQAGQSFLTDIVRERSIGQILNGEPVVGSRGLADAMARMKLNFDVLKGQMGFNNPQVETNRFSLRYELFRITDEEESDDIWREQLAASRVDNLWDVPEFRRYARPFAPEEAGPQPGLVITFDTNVLFGLNFFGNELGPNDSAYDSSQFSTRIRGVGTWFESYANLPLANTPRMYLIPIGADVMRSPDADDFNVRQWQILDQVVPVPLPLGATDLDAHDWLPSIDNQIGDPTEIRRYSQYLAYHFTEPFDIDQVASNSRLVGRSVWNRKWMMIIPGASFLNDPNEGLDTFIDGQLIPDGDGERDGNGVDDIHLFFTTYSYSGN